MEWLSSDWNVLYGWINAPWFTIGTTPISAARLVGLVVILVLVWWFAYAVEQGMRRMALHGRTHVTGSTVYTFARMVRYLVWIVGTIVGLNYLGFNLASFAFIGGAVGVGIGFGLQNIFSNFISGIIILLEKTLKVGDFVDLQSGVMGTVTEIGVRYTRVTTNDAVDILVPNSEFINGRVTNWTFGGAFRRMRVRFGVAYGSDKNLVREAGIAAAMRVAGTIADENRKPDVWLVGFGESSLDFDLAVWVGPELIASPGHTHAKYLWALEEELTRRNIQIPFPQRDVRIVSGTPSTVASPAAQSEQGR
jgi:small-conductance mechanosensitive channel